MKKLFLKKKKSDKNDPKVLKKLYIRLQIEFLIMFGLFAFFVYFNYDYFLFKILISQNYIYTDALDSIYEDELGVKNSKDYTKSFDNLAISLITKRITEENDDIYTYLYLSDEYNESLEDMKKDAEKSYFKEIKKNVAYMKITNFSTTSRKILFDNEEKLKDYEYLILDLRDNGGGYLSDTYKMADLFLPKGAVICTEKTRKPIFSSINKAKTPQELSFKHIYILQNEYTASSAEVVVNALKENLENVTIVGTRSYGKGIGQAEFRLKNNYAIKATTIELETPRGNSIHKKGIKPDIEYNEEDIVEFVEKII